VSDKQAIRQALTPTALTMEPRTVGTAQMESLML
jgi:hypothetical protein